jgi:hypothetical protein
VERNKGQEKIKKGRQESNDKEFISFAMSGDSAEYVRKIIANVEQVWIWKEEVAAYF